MIGLLGAYFSTFMTNFMDFTIVFSVCFGVCNGFTYTIPLKICWDYFPDRKGMVSGVVICGFGLGAALFNFIST